MNTAHEASASVLHERRGGVPTITLNRPAQKNAVDHDPSARPSVAAGHPVNEGP
jgi:enoyl-CoA hydratase